VEKIVITGGAGFIGSHVVDRILSANKRVGVLDNLSTGRKSFIQKHLENPAFEFHKVDLVTERIERYFEHASEVWHVAANPNVREYDADIYEAQIKMTLNVLEAMRKRDVKKIVFVSSSTVYGEAIKRGKIEPTPEDFPTVPISLYGASKLACESLIEAYSHVYGLQCWILRLANIIGPRLTHGAIFDFVEKLRKNPNELEILGNGEQKKSYLYVDDCVDAMLTAREKSNERVNVFNVGNEDWITVREIAEIVCKIMNLRPRFRFTGGDRGWRGDVPLMLLDITKIKRVGFSPRFTSREAVEKTVKYLVESGAPENSRF